MGRKSLVSVVLILNDFQIGTNTILPISSKMSLHMF